MKTLTLLTVLLCTLIVNAQTFPIDFETGTAVFEDFDGGISSVIANPQASGINTSATVAQIVKGAGETWAGNKLKRTSTISFATNQVFTMKVYSPKAGINVLFKLEKEDDYTVAQERVSATTVANQWETLTYDFSGSSSDVYTHITIIFENGTAGDGSADWTFLIDDIEFSPSSAPALTLPIDFEGGPYLFTDFDGGVATVIANPQSSGENTSATVAQMVRNGGATWAGSKLILNDKIDFSTAATFSMKVYSSRVGIPVLFKLEGDAQTELSTNTTVANQWETLTWDFTGQPSNTFNTLALMFDFGAVGDGSANSIFLFDDIQLIDGTGGLSQIDLPVTFDDGTVDYTLTDFGENSTVIGVDPKDANNTVAITTKPANAATWAGTTIGTAIGFKNAAPFTETKTSISVKVYSPAIGSIIRLKGESSNDVTLTAETEQTTTVANAWETLVFDFSNVAVGTNPFNLTTAFDKFSIFFEFGTTGTESTYYWDDVMFVDEENNGGGETGGDAPSLPLDFEAETYSWMGFDGGEVSIIDNAQKSGINTSDKVAQMVKSAGQNWGGSWIALESAIDFSKGTTFKMKVYSPKVGAKVLLKVENKDDSGLNFEKEAATTKANEWEELEFDYSAINTANEYHKIIIIFELGTMGDGSADFTYLFDDIVLGEAGSSALAGTSVAKLEVYPNPTTGKLNIDAANGSLVSVYGITGQLKSQNVLESGSISMSHLVNGIYFVKVNNKVSQVIKR